MEQRALGRTGQQVSALGFGAGNIGGLMVRGDVSDQRRAVARAIEAGISYFDTAPAYGDGRSEETLGRVLRELGAEVIVGTKFRLAAEEVADAPRAVRRSLEASLRRLGRERVDLFQLHNRVGGADRDALSAEQVLGPVAEGLAAVREAGLTRFIGLTGLGEADPLHEVVAAGAFDTVQCYLNALNPTAGWPIERPAEQDFRGLVGRAAEAGLGVIAIRVLAAGALADGGQRHPLAGEPGGPLVAGASYERDVERASALRELAAELGLEGPAELSLRLVLSHPGVSTALVGYSEPDHLEAAIRWAERGPLEPAAVERIVALSSTASG